MRISSVLPTEPSVLVVGPGCSATYGTGSRAATAARSTVRKPATASTTTRRDMAGGLRERAAACRSLRLTPSVGRLPAGPVGVERRLEARVLLEGLVGVGPRPGAARPDHPHRCPHPSPP